MTQSCDGFVIAEADLNLRGPGEFYGTKQSGVPEFQIADILRDQMVLTETREAALALVHGDPLLEKTSNLALKAAIAHNLAGFSLATVS
jgi:ATP-dependent DNA helicase RecG